VLSPRLYVHLARGMTRRADTMNVMFMAQDHARFGDEE
jgi:hypothetical protein